MSNKTKISVAKDFIARHKNDNVEDWFLGCRTSNETNRYLEIFAKLEGGVFGECRDDAEYDEDGALVAEATEFEVEIRGHESKSGNPVTFSWSNE